MYLTMLIKLYCGYIIYKKFNSWIITNNQQVIKATSTLKEAKEHINKLTEKKLLCKPKE